MSAGTPRYPIAEHEPERIATASGRPLSALSLDNVLAGQVPRDDLSITAEALRLQAQVARAAGRAPLADNFERAAELVAVPQEFVLEVYELLRPGRAAARRRCWPPPNGCAANSPRRKSPPSSKRRPAQYEQRNIFRRRF